MSLRKPLAALALLLMLAVITVHQRTARERRAFEVRRVLDDQARLCNEVRWLRGSVLRLEAPSFLLERAAKAGIRAGEMTGRTRVAPKPEETGPGQ